MMKKEKGIKIRKDLSKIVSKAKQAMRPNKCILCGKSIEGCCNSHSVPQMILREIEKDGMIFCAPKVMELGFNKLCKDIKFIEEEAGINKSGTFQFICRKCDSDFFKDYENIENLMNDEICGSNKVLSEIATKNITRLLNYNF